VDARTQAWADQEDARLVDTIRRHGWAIRYVGGGLCDRPGCDGGHSDEPPFAYTIGLFGLAHPELLVFGIDPGTAAGVLNVLGERIRAGGSLLPGQLVQIDDWPHRIIPKVVPNPGDIVFEANRYYLRPDQFSVPVLQLSYDDVDGRFPWEQGYARPDLQPRPGTFSA
jgi:hypothetical protein